MKVIIIIGALSALFAVILGAFGAHGLKHVLTPSALQTFEIGVRYQFYHALAMLVLPALLNVANAKWLTRAGGFFFAGILCFSGSLYLLATMGHKWLGPITPFGGLLFMLGWVCIVVAAVKGKQVDE